MNAIVISEQAANSDEKYAEELKNWLGSHQVLLADFFSSPGAGKTTLLKQLYSLMKKAGLSAGVLEADYDSSHAISALRDLGYPTVRMLTPDGVHLDARMVYEGLNGFESRLQDELDIVFLENNGSLSRPVSLKTGAHAEILVFSIPEGEDKPLKYPASFQRADLLVVSKSDAAEHFHFNMDRFLAAVRVLNPNLPIIRYSSKTGEGLQEIADWIEARQRRLTNEKDSNSKNSKTE
ncbi:hydrogenase nickel incorporation protein HypB [Ileibacterium valens]|uniref:Hydrogenase accessory protein HypB n=1 Tax=Ileibacterium valens TaxID=1862668 RepID=A0A1U7NE97_9FIRM|nr:hydrogenase nickel incorporation protein HypB [Ileibacterium valens]OLU36622.1 hydrogenase accessory protein HypB [Erysipelotrichaceae bacterium NYU-BL-E8]OLU37827.1 hydrogenase accessory protein HypB [Ileibacterium valens]OLU41874.1 hydrogenase accessory protein HypB [Erysipelotrichaceae bacterium NYU-BL-F16]